MSSSFLYSSQEGFAAGLKGPLPPHLELFAAGGALELVAVAAAAVLAVLPPHPALERLAAVGAYEGLLAGVGVEVLLELALEAEDLAAYLARVLVVQEHLQQTERVTVFI